MEAITIEINQEGILDFVKKSSLSKWKNRYVRLVDGGIYIYKTDKDEDFKCIDLEFSVLDSNPKEAGNRPNSFLIRDSHNKAFLFSANTSQEYNKWLENVKRSTGKKNSGCPTFDSAVAKREGRNDIMFRAKKNISGKIASSGVGKSGLKKLIPEEGRELIGSVKKIIKRVSNEEKANEMEKNILKILIKVFFYIDSKAIQIGDLAKVDRALRDGFNHLDRAFRYYGVKKAADLVVILEKASTALKEAEHETVTLLTPFFRPHNIQLIRNTFAFLGSLDFFTKVWDDLEIEDDLFLLISALNKYTQIELIY
ncbi:hypothetical protein ACTFIW_009254 [Dictyostelium discoideum]